MQKLTTATVAGVNLSLSFMNLTVSVHAAVGEDKSAKMTTLCTNGHEASPIRQLYRCPVCSSEDRSTFRMGKAVDGGYVMLTDEVKDAVRDAAQAVKGQLTLTIHPAHEVTSVLLPSGKSYYLSLKAGGEKPSKAYTLLSRLVTERSDLAFMGKFTLSSATSIFQLVTAGDGTLVLRQMANAELVREHPVINWVEPSARELELVGMIADEEIVPFVESEHGTGRTTIIADFVDAQAPVSAAAASEGPLAQVIDMAESLEAMLAAKLAAKGTPAKGKGRRAKVSA